MEQVVQGNNNFWMNMQFITSCQQSLLQNQLGYLSTHQGKTRSYKNLVTSQTPKKTKQPFEIIKT